MEQHQTSGGVELSPSRYLVVVESSLDGFSAYVPDLPGCIAAAETREEVEDLIRVGIALYIETLRERDEPVPIPSTRALEIGVA